MSKIKKIGISLIKEKYFTQSDLLKLGWSLEEIKTLLPKATLYENLTNSKFPPIKCWNKAVVNRLDKKRAKFRRRSK